MKFAKLGFLVLFLQCLVSTVSTALAAPPAFAADTGPNHRTWVGSVVAEVDRPDVSRLHRDARVVEIATGMHYWDGQGWKPSEASFEVTPNAFIANRLQHMVSLNDDLNRVGAVTVVTHDGVVLHSTPVAIGLYDAATGNSTIIAGIQKSPGVLVRPNKVLYQNAFRGLDGEEVCADVAYTVDRGSFEQDVIITGRIDPATYGFPRETTRIQIYTEFYEAPRPQRIRRPIRVEDREEIRRRMESPDLVDEVLGFGEFVVATGRAFASAATPDKAAAPVAKEFITNAGRTFLIETVEYTDIQRELELLPPCNRGRAALNRGRPPAGKVNYATVPTATSRSDIRAGGAPADASSRIAKAETPVATGVVIDYIATVGGTLNSPVTFNGDTTYFVSGAVFCNGAATIEGGAVFKFKHQTTAPVGYASIRFNNTITCKTSSYRPAIFTAVDDDSVGETLNGYPGAGYQQPVRTDGYANPAVWLYFLSSQQLGNLRFTYCQEAVRVEGGSGNNLSHAQLVKCIRGIVITGCGSGCSTPITVKNALFANVSSPVTISRPSVFPAFYHTTVQSTPAVATLVAATASSTCNFYNSLIANVTAISSGPVTMGGDYNGFHSAPQFGLHPVSSAAFPFQTVGAANYYLTSTSIFRNAGTSNGIDASLLAEIRRRTVDPPTLLASNIYSTAVVFAPQVPVDSGLPDLGYHYPVLDYLVCQLVASTTGGPLIMTNGVAMGLFGNFGFAVPDGGVAVSEGAAVPMNQIVWYPSVQEQPALLNNVATRNSGVFSVASATNNAANTVKPTIGIRFTEFPMLGLRQPLFHGSAYALNLKTISIKDSVLRGVDFSIPAHNVQFPAIPVPVLTLWNNVLERSSLSLFNGYANTVNSPLQLTLYNSSFWGSALNLTYNDNQALYHPPWTIQDNLFDSAAISFAGNGSYLSLVSRSYNGFFATPGSTQLGGTGNVNLTALTYATGPNSWPWYIGSSTPSLQNVDTSRTAATAGLYHYTTFTNQIKEQASAVDLGFHYVALNGNSLPVDTDGDGVPDYIEDSNGNGFSDENEQSYNNPSISLGATPLNYTENAPAAVVSSTATVADSDSANFSGGTLTIDFSANGLVEDRISIRDEGNGAGQIGVVWPNIKYGGVTIGAGSGTPGNWPLVIAFNSSASVAAVQAVVRNVTYHNDSDNPSVAARSLRMVVADGRGGTSSPALKTVNVSAVNDAPAIVLLGGALNYIKRSVAKEIDSSALAADPDSSDFNQGQLNVTFGANWQNGDRLGVHNEGTGTGQIGVSGANVTYGGTMIGTHSGGSSSNPLTVQLNGSANLPAVQALLKNITYANTLSRPVESSRPAEFTLSDGDGGTSAGVAQTVTVTCAAKLDVILVLDISGSLTPGDFDKAKAAAAKVAEWLDPGDHRVGLVPFCGSVQEQFVVPLTFDGQQVIDMLANPALDQCGGTLFLDPVERAIDELKASERDALRVMVLISDGKVASGNEGNRSAAAAAALAAEAEPKPIRNLAVGYGNDCAGINFLKDVASNCAEPGGCLNPTDCMDFYYAPSASQFESVLATLVQDLCEKTPPILIYAIDNVYTIGNPPVAIAPFQLEDGDAVTFNTGTLQAWIGNPQLGDSLGLWGTVGTTGGNVVYNSTVIGTFASASQTAMNIVFNANSTREAVEALLNGLTYHYSGENTGSRSIHVIVTDSDQLSSDPALIPILVAYPNQPPFVDAGPDQSVSLGAIVELNGFVEDDGLPVPPQPPEVYWEQISGPGTADFANANLEVTTVTFDQPGAYVLRLHASDIFLANYDDVGICVGEPGQASYDAGPDQVIAVQRANPTTSDDLRSVGTGFLQPVGIDYHDSSRNLIVSVNYPTGLPHNLAIVSPDGRASAFAGVKGLGEELKIATARDAGAGRSLGGFSAGEMFSGNGIPGQIIRISPDGTTVRNPWVTLNSDFQLGGFLRGGLHVDRTGVFEGDLLAVTTKGGVWRVTESGTATLLARITGVHLEGVTTVPNEPQYGPWAGKILAGAETQGRIYAIDKNSTPQAPIVEHYSLGINPEDIDIIPRNENFFAVDYAGGKIWGAPAQAFAGFVDNNVLVTEESPAKLWRVNWTGTEFNKSQLYAEVPIQQFEHVTFAPAGIGAIAPIASVNLAGRTLNAFCAEVQWGVSATPFGATVTFGNGNSLQTPAYFSHSGTYVLRLGAPDCPCYDEVTINVVEQIAPVVSFPSAPLSYAPGAPAQIVDPAATAEHATAANFGGGRLSISLSENGRPDDRLSFRSGSGITWSEPNRQLQYGGNVIGTFTGGDGVAPIVVSLTAHATPAATEVLLRNLTYRNVTATPGFVTRTIRAVLSDGAGGVSLPAYQFVNVLNAPPQNQPPLVVANDNPSIAGCQKLDQVFIVTNPDTLTLNGCVQDDGLPSGTLRKWWSVVRRPTYASVQFSRIDILNPVVDFLPPFGFEAPGLYVLRLEATDGELSASDDVTVVVLSEFEQNTKPFVDAGEPQSVTLGQSASVTVQLAGIVVDDGVPGTPPLSKSWSGPPGAVFANPSLPSSTVTFTAPGQYTLTLTADDHSATPAEPVSDSVIITVCQGPAGPVDVALIIDRSGSMSGNAIEDAKTAAINFVDRLNPALDQIAVVSFDDNASLDHPLSKDKESLKDSIRRIYPLLATDPAQGIYIAHQELTGPRHNRGALPVIILLTDGLPAGQSQDETERRHKAAIAAANSAKAAGLRIITIWFDSLGVNLGTGPQPNAAGEEFLRNLASAGEDFYLAEDSAALDKAYASIADSFCLPRNRRPIVFAGADRVINRNETIVLSGQAVDDGLPNGTLAVNWSAVEPPAPVTFSPGPTSLGVTASGFTMSGEYVLRLTADDSDDTSYAEMQVTVNEPPVVDPGSYGPILLIGSVVELTLVGSASDPDTYPPQYPQNRFRANWRLVQGPAAVEFVQPPGDDFPPFPIENTPVRLFAPGSYIFELSADDSLGSSSAQVTIQVLQPLVVQVGVDTTVQIEHGVRLDGTIIDPLEPPGDYSLTWTKLSGPGEANFVDATAADTDVTFTLPGSYQLRLTALDFAYNLEVSAELTVIVDFGTLSITAPSLVPFGELTGITGQAINGSGMPVTITWNQESGPGTVTFGDRNLPSTTAAFSAPGRYSIRLDASSGTTLFGSVYATIVVNDSPKVAAGIDTALTPPRIEPTDTVFLIGTATDDGFPANSPLSLEWARQAGPGEVTFSDPNSLRTSATFSQPGVYVLRFSAFDSHLTGHSSLSVAVGVPVVLTPDNFTVYENSTNNALQVLGNDSALSIVAITQPSYGFASIVAGQYILYSPRTDFAGRDQVYYEVSDGRTVPAYITVKPINQPPVANPDVYSAAPGAGTYFLNPLDNDRDADIPFEATIEDFYVSALYQSHFKVVSWTSPNHGTLMVQNVVKNYGCFACNVPGYWFLYTADSEGTPYIDEFTYTIMDAEGATSTATVYVYVSESSTTFEPPPVVDAGNNQTIQIGTSITLNPTIRNKPNQTVSLTWDVVGGDPSQVTIWSPNFATSTVDFDSPGVYVLRLTAETEGNAPVIDTVTITVVDDPSPPIAQIFNLRNDPKGLIPDPIIDTGFFDLRGIADDADPGDSVGYKITLFAASDEQTAVADLTPTPRDGEGFYVQRVPGTQGNDLLGRLDFTAVPNGMYLLVLTVKGGGVSVSTSVRFALATELKLGRFTFSEKDITIPVNGLSLAVQRTYDSFNLRNGEFGFGWSYSVLDSQIQLDEQRANVLDDEGNPINLRIGGNRNITLTLPNGRRTTFTFGIRQGPLWLYAEYRAARGVQETLTPIGENRLNASIGSLAGEELLFWQAGGFQMPFEYFDFPGFVLETTDGTKYFLTREDQDPQGLGTFLDDGTFVHPYGPPKLTGILYRDGQQVIISNQEGSEFSVEHFDQNNVKTRSLRFQRENGRIVGVRDPGGYNELGNPVGPLAVKYVYDLVTGNLDEVHRLIDREANGGEGSYQITRYVYDDRPGLEHYLKEIIDPRGVKPVINEYDENGVLTAIADESGRRTEFDYSGKTFIPRTSMTTERRSDGTIFSTTQHMYDDRGNVTGTFTYDPVLGQQLTSVVRTYNADNLMSSESVDGGANRFEYEYDSRGNITRTMLPTFENFATKHQESFTYNGFGQVESATDARGKTRYFEYDDKGNLLRTTDAVQTDQEYHYENNRLKQTTDALGNVTEYTYYTGSTLDSGGNAGDLKSITVKEEHETAPGQFDYIVRSQTTYRYDANGNRQFETQLRTLTDGVTQQLLETEFLYDAQNRVRTTYNPLRQVTSTEYNSLGKAAATTDKFGKQTQFFYDRRGNLVQTVYPADTTGGSPTFTPVTVARTIYDEYGRAVYVQDRHEKPASGTDSTATGTRFLYDVVGRTVGTERLSALTVRLTQVGPEIYRTEFISSTSADPAVLTWTEYDIAGRVWTAYDSRNLTKISETQFGPIDSGWYTRYIYDETGRRQRIEMHTGVWENNAEIVQTAAYTYDANGNLKTVQDPLGRVTEYEYDAENRPILTRFPLVAGESRTTRRTAYDVLGRKISETDQAGVTTRFGHDAQGRLGAVTNNYRLAGPNHFVTFYRYDEVGNLTHQTDANGHVTTVDYDELGRRIKRTLPQRKPGDIPMFETFTYDENAAGQLANEQTHTDFNGRQTRMVFDPLHRLRRKIPDPAFAAAPVVFNYWPGGQRKTVVDASGTISYLLGAQNRVQSKTTTYGALNYALDYTYDANGNVLTTTSTQGGTDVVYTWDRFNRLEAVTDNRLGASQTTYQYDLANNLRRVTPPTGAIPAPTIYETYDELNRLRHMKIGEDEFSLQATYTYDVGPAGNRTRVTEMGGRTVKYSYDNLYRLLEEKIGDDAVAPYVGYAYDNAGNRLSRNSTIDGLLSRPLYTYDDNDRLVSDRDESGTTRNYTFDDNGNTLQGEVTPLPTANDQYDFENRLVRRTVGAITIELVYDADGNRVRKIKTDNSSGSPVVTTTYYVVDSVNPTGYAQVLEERGHNGSAWTINKAYVYGRQIVSQRQADDTVHFYGFDGQGNVRALLNTAGFITDTYTYDAFGSVIALSLIHI